MVGKAVREAERVCAYLEQMCASEPQVASKAPSLHWHNTTDALPGPGRPNGEAARHLTVASVPGAYPLTPREREVLAEITAGASNKGGSQKLGNQHTNFRGASGPHHEKARGSQRRGSCPHRAEGNQVAWMQAALPGATRVRSGKRLFAVSDSRLIERSSCSEE